MAAIKYYLDGVDFSTYSVCVSESDGVLDIPARKKPFSQSWDDEHGEVVDLRKKYYEPREITLNCFIEANGEIDFVTKLNTFLLLFDAVIYNHRQSESKNLGHLWTFVYKCLFDLRKF